MRFALVLVLLLVGCESGHDDGDLQFERVGYPDCVGTIPLPELPIERELIYSGRPARRTQRRGRVTQDATGRLVITGTVTETGIEFEEYSYVAEIESWPPLRYAEIYFNRMAHFVDGGDVLTIEDSFNSYGDDLTCWHQFTMD